MQEEEHILIYICIRSGPKIHPLHCDLQWSIVLNILIYHPCDWYWLIYTVCKNNTFHITEMEREHFLDVGLLLKRALSVQEGERWRSAFCLANSNMAVLWRNGVMCFGPMLDNDRSFRKVSFWGWGCTLQNIHLEPPYKTSHSITIEEKNDLASILH
jgi:hypothetical protein